MKFLKYILNEDLPTPPSPGISTNQPVTPNQQQANISQPIPAQKQQPAPAPQNNAQNQPQTSNKPLSQQNIDNLKGQLSRLPQYKIVRLLKNLNALRPQK